MVVIGAAGQVGSDLMRLAAARPSWRTIGARRQDLDITDHDRAARTLEQWAPSVIINTAAYHRVDDCEDQAALAFRVNAAAVLNLARISERLGALLVHLGTDYVFGTEVSRTTPYSEDDRTGPVNVYGASKLAGETLIRAYCRKHLIVRSAGIYGHASGPRTAGKSFVEIMLDRAAQGSVLRVVDDQRTAPTYSADLAQAILQLVDDQALGVYHLTNEGECTWHEFAMEIFRQTGLSPDLQRTTSTGYAARARRPHYSVLKNRRWKQGGYRPLRPWAEALADYLAQRRSLTI